MKIIIYVVLALFISGCAQKVQIKALVPAEVGAMASKKKIAVSKFKNDVLGLSGKIESKISNQSLDNKRYFSVVSRKDMSKVIAEQRLQASDFMDETTSSRIGKLIGAQAIINGEILSSNTQSASYLVDRKKCVNYNKETKKCDKYRHYKVRCNTLKASVSANLNIVDIETGSIIYGDSISKTYNGDSCKKRVLSNGQALDSLASKIANGFVYKLTPKYIYFKVTLLEEIEVDSTSLQKEKLKYSLEYLEAGRVEKARKILDKLLDELNGTSYVVAYNLGVINEALGDLEMAKKLYTMADELSLKPIEEVNSAVIRIESSILKSQEAKKQMNAK